MPEGLNGKWEEYRREQGERFTQLELVIREGFDSLTNEMRLNRTSGLIPMDIMKSLLVTKEETFRITLRWVFAVFGIVIVVLSGFKGGFAGLMGLIGR